MRWEERAALQLAAQIEAQELAAKKRAQNRQVKSMRDLMLRALPVARDAGMSATQLSDAWSIPRGMIIAETDRVHRSKKYDN